MTEKLYYRDVFIKEFTAVITKAVYDEDGLKLVLDRTAFYPEGGGQGADHGVLELSDGRKLYVSDVQELDGEIVHFAAEAAEAAEAQAVQDTVSAEDRVPAAGDGGNDPDLQAADARQDSDLTGMNVTGRIDWTRRFDHMQQHSGEHIVSGMICRRFSCDNVGFHLGEDVVTIDFNARITMEQAIEIEQQANQYIWENHPFQAVWPSAQELAEMEYRSKKELEGDVRITSFPGADTCACCGTHVACSAQVGLVKFISAKPFHEGTRLELLCGSRAMNYLSVNFTENKRAAVLLSASEENTSSHVEKLLEEQLKLKAALSAMEDKLFHMWAEAFRGKGNVLVIEEQMTSEQARTLADLIADRCGGMAAVFAHTGDRYSYAVIQRDTEISPFIKEMNAVLNGRGGGRNGFAQGSVSADKAEIEAFFEKRSEQNESCCGR